jgi:PAS domain S-box-containing protein
MDHQRPKVSSDARPTWEDLLERVAQLEQQQQNFIELVESIQDGFLAIDHDWRFTYVNRRAAENVGFSPADLVGRNLWEQFPSLVGTQQEAAYHRVMSERIPVTMELRGTLTDRWYRMSIYPAAQGVSVFWTDVSEHKRAEQALSESEGQYRNLFERTREANDLIENVLGHLDDSFAVFDSEWRYVFLNDATVFRLGRPRDQVLGKRLLELIPQMGESSAWARLQAVAHERRDAEWVEQSPVTGHWLNWHAFPWKGGVAVISRDVTDWKRVDEALRVSEEVARRRAEELQALMEVVPAAIWVANDPECRHITGNKAGNRFYEAEHGENVSAGPAIGGEQDTRRRFFANRVELPPEALPMQQSATTGREVRESELEVLLPSGNRISMLGNAVPLFNADGRVRGSVGAFINITARKRAEEALRTSEERLRLAQLSGDVGVWDWDVTTGRVFWTPELESIYGLEPGTVHCYEDFATRVHPDDVEGMGAKRDAALRSHQPFDLEFRIIRPSGDIRWLMSKGRGFYDQSGQLIRVVGNNIDITERKRAEEALFAANQRVAALMNALPVGVSFSDDTTCTRINGNPAVLAQFEVSSDDNLSASGPDPAAPGRQVRFFREGQPITDTELPLQRAVAENREIEPMELEIELPSGRRWFAVATGAPVRDRAGNVTGGIAVTMDVTAQKRALEALRESEERLRLAQAAGRIGAFEWNLITNVNTWTPELERMYGIPVGSFGKTQRSWEELLHPDDRAGTVARVEHAFATGDPEEAEFRIVWPDGSVHWLSGRWQVFKDADGKPVRLTGVNIDVTTRKATEASLLDANAALAEADRRKDEFIAILSHELRNPLAPIRFALPILESERLSDTGSRAVSVIQRQTEHLRRLVDDLLDVSRITTGQIEPHREQVTLRSVVTAAIEAATPALAATPRTLNVSVAEQRVWLNVDPVRLAQVVTNLLDNSAKYTPSGGQIALDAYPEGDQAVIKVRDTGIGIPSESLPIVFDMFQRVKGPDRPQGGLGIGLAVAKRLVELHDGTIEVQSAGVGQGSEFVLRVPVAQPTAPPERSGDTSIARPLGRRLRVLIVEDSQDMLDMLAIVVEGDGHDVRKALDGSSAIATAMSFRPDVVLLDLGLPSMSGFEVARELRRRSETVSARIVALTGWGQPEDRRQTREAGFDHHLTKPTNPEEVTALLETYAIQAT